jgi:hypothetical protein
MRQILLLAPAVPLAFLVAASCVSAPTDGQVKASVSTRGQVTGEPEEKSLRPAQFRLDERTLIWKTQATEAAASASLKVNESGSLDIHLKLRNQGRDPIYLLTVQPWRISRKGRAAYLTFGTNEVMYGSELPVLRRLATGEEFETASSLQAPIDVEELNSIVIGFFGIFEGAVSFEDELSGLPEVAGWWQTDDWGLTDRFLDYLVYQPIEFPLVPLKEGLP